MRRKPVVIAAAAGLVAVVLSGCAGTRDDRSVGAAVQPPDNTSARSARLITPAAPMQCVPYARAISEVSIRGNAWTWWRAAAGRYRRDSRPAVGSILVLKQTDRLRYGHVAVVSRVVGRREILVDHANWLNRGRVHRDLPVRDVSTGNDWSAIRVWYLPGNTLGKRTYPAHGFIHPRQARLLQFQEPSMRGPDVRTLQGRLKHEGIDVAADGVFGRATYDALMTYQQRNGLAQDGIAGPSTRAKLGY